MDFILITSFIFVIGFLLIKLKETCNNKSSIAYRITLLILLAIFIKLNIIVAQII